MRWYPIVLLICISLMISDIEHFFMFLWLLVCLLLRSVCSPGVVAHACNPSILEAKAGGSHEVGISRPA